MIFAILLCFILLLLIVSSVSVAVYISAPRNKESTTTTDEPTTTTDEPTTTTDEPTTTTDEPTTTTDEPTTTTYSGQVDKLISSISYPSNMAVDSLGNIFFCNNIKFFMIKDFSNYIALSEGSYNQCCVDSDDNVYFVDINNKKIIKYLKPGLVDYPTGKIQPDGTFVETIFPTQTFVFDFSPKFVAVDGTGRIYTINDTTMYVYTKEGISQRTVTIDYAGITGLVYKNGYIFIGTYDSRHDYYIMRYSTEDNVLETDPWATFGVGYTLSVGTDNYIFTYGLSKIYGINSLDPDDRITWTIESTDGFIYNGNVNSVVSFNNKIIVGTPSNISIYEKDDSGLVNPKIFAQFMPIVDISSNPITEDCYVLSTFNNISAIIKIQPDGTKKFYRLPTQNPAIVPTSITWNELAIMVTSSEGGGKIRAFQINLNDQLVQIGDTINFQANMVSINVLYPYMYLIIGNNDGVYCCRGSNIQIVMSSDITISQLTSQFSVDSGASITNQVGIFGSGAESSLYGMIFDGQTFPVFNKLAEITPDSTYPISVTYGNNKIYASNYAKVSRFTDSGTFESQLTIPDFEPTALTMSGDSLFIGSKLDNMIRVTKNF